MSNQTQSFQFKLSEEPNINLVGDSNVLPVNEYVGVEYKNSDDQSSTFVMVDTNNKTKTIIEFLKYLEEIKNTTENEEVLEKIQDCCDATEELLQIVKNPPPEIKVEYLKESDLYTVKLSYEAYEALKVYIDADLIIDKNRQRLASFIKENIMDLIRTSIET